MTMISEHLTLAEVTKNNTAIKYGLDNTPTPEHEANLKLVCERIFEPLRTGLGDKPIYVSCGYRSVAVNAKTPGASKTSGHCFGKALDLEAHVFGGMTNADIFHYIRKNLKFNELIWEHGNDTEPAWVHVLYDEKDNKGEVLQTCVVNGKPKYKPWVPMALRKPMLG